MPGLLDALMQYLSQAQQPIGILGNYGAPLTLSDESQYPILPWGQYAMDYSKQKRGIPDAVPRGEGGGGQFTAQEREMERALEQIRRESAGLTREQRREQMRQQGQGEFNRVQDMSPAEWEAELAKIRGVLRR